MAFNSADTTRVVSRRRNPPTYGAEPPGGEMSETTRVVSAELKAIVEALIFASPDPLTPKMLYRLLADEPKEDVKATVEALKADYDSRPGLQFVEVAGGYQILTRPELHEWVRRLFQRTLRRRS